MPVAGLCLSKDCPGHLQKCGCARPKAFGCVVSCVHVCMLPRIVGVLMDALHLHFMMQRMSSYLCCAAAVGGLETSCALQMLAYMQLMLQQLPNCRPLQHYEAAAGEGSCTIINFRALWELLLLLALKQDHAAVRCGTRSAAAHQVLVA